MQDVYPVLWILIALLWLTVGIILGYVIRGAKAVDLLEYHNNRLMDLMLSSHLEHDPTPARVRDTESETVEAVAMQRINEQAVSGLAAYIAEQGGVSLEKARQEAEQMLGQFAPAAHGQDDTLRTPW